MMMISDYLSEMLEHVKFVLKYLHKNAWTIVFILGGSYFVFDSFIDPLLHEYRSSKSRREASDPSRLAVLGPDMRRTRARQQELSIQRSIEAAEERKIKVKEDRERKRVKSPEEERWDKMGGVGKALGDSKGD